ncbi:DUF1284 domain-containing protein [Clostridium folliculivorans]|uniref:Uncharacterized protein n=1 Tax=Clostridium folliculivorans TaxID=2886038 RepID=A0A9W5Y0D1_9CLOT|nr:DUF1284 domain-containing protein [Clostridium folliculivorans]GKU24399.1 hypothetical protein CFOLD11_12250 [Clostridium folliculivorans]GKU30495.1 hypothetical protein CFB3_26020 [Clostridium folliculivorans]
MIKIKPHHFMDIIKLYGFGIEKFIPDRKYNHNFYLIANEILKDKNVKIEITIGKDDICMPCKYIKNDICQDFITHIQYIKSKDEWNKIIDKRILEYAELQVNQILSAYELCNKLYLIKEKINDIWKEECEENNFKRYTNFCLGAQKYLEF